jgi:Mandelate racemase / muconate lactonizing enzyme, N-terminal domain
MIDSNMQSQNTIDPAIQSICASAYRIPTDYPESDGTLEWQSTTLVVVEAEGGGSRGLGYTYADTSTAKLINDLLAKVVEGQDAMAITGNRLAMIRTIRNLGRPGIASMAIAAVDNALWDLKARLLSLPLVTLLGAARDSVAIYGSGGFTSYDESRLCGQLSGWIEQGIPRVKMKVGRHQGRDPQRVSAARKAIGPEAALLMRTVRTIARLRARLPPSSGGQMSPGSRSPFRPTISRVCVRFAIALRWQSRLASMVTHCRILSICFQHRPLTYFRRTPPGVEAFRVFSR